jgi:hypothetical protein
VRDVPDDWQFMVAGPGPGKVNVSSLASTVSVCAILRVFCARMLLTIPETGNGDPPGELLKVESIATKNDPTVPLKVIKLGVPTAMSPAPPSVTSVHDVAGKLVSQISSTKPACAVPLIPNISPMATTAVTNPFLMSNAPSRPTARELCPSLFRPHH